MQKQTQKQTLWGETLLEMLFYSLRKNKKDREVREIIQELRGNGYGRSYLVDQTDQRLGANAVGRVRRLSV